MSRLKTNKCSQCKHDIVNGVCLDDCARNKNRLAVRKYKQTKNGRTKQRECHRRYRESENGYNVRLEHSRKRRERKKGLDSNFTANDSSLVLEKFNYTCFNCGMQECLRIDHHHPLAHGHGLTIDNAVVLCESCNCKKHKKNPRRFYTESQLIELEVNYGIKTN